jgi:hypothetical protein
MLRVSHLGDTRSDLVNVLALPFGASKANQIVADLENLIRKKAQEGTGQALVGKADFIRSQVRAEVEKTVRPIFFAAAAVSLIGIGLGLAGLRR